MVQMVVLFCKSKFKMAQQHQTGKKKAAEKKKCPAKLFTVLATETRKVAFQIEIIKSSMHSTCELHSVWAGCAESGMHSFQVCIAAIHQTSLLACKQLSPHYTTKE